MNSTLRLRVHKAPLTETPPPPILLLGGPVSVGRRDDNGWVLPDSTASVSRKHATVEERNGIWLLLDESANGTLHNGQLVGRGNARPLAVGDMIKIGDYEIVVEPAPDTGGGPGIPMTPPVQPLADPYGVADLARGDFGAPPPPPSGPSPFDPPPPDRLASEAPRNADLFGDFAAHQVAPGVGIRANPDAPAASFGGLDAPVDPLAGGAPSPFGAPGGPPEAPFGGPPPAGGDWGVAPNPVPSAGGLVNDPLSNPGGSSVFGDQFGSADAIRNPLGGSGSPFPASEPAEYKREHAPAELGFDIVAVPEIGGPRASSALPTDWNAPPQGGGPAPPPADLDPIEQALAGLKPGATPAAEPAAPRPAPAPPPPGGDFFAPMEDAFAHPSVPRPATPAQPRPGTPVGAPTAPAAAPPQGLFQTQGQTPAQRPAPRPAPAPQPPAPSTPQPAARAPAPPSATATGDALLRAFMEGAGLQQLPPDIDPVQAMRTLGASARAIVATLARLLEARRLLKGEFRITQTVVGARENNPLKFSVDESELMLVLLGAVRPGFQRGEAAVWDAGRDLEAHQLAMLAAFRAVMDAVFARLSPDAVASGEEAGFFGRLLPQARDAALWERYVKLYGDLRQDIGNTLAGRLGQIFAEAYEAENGRRGGSR